MQKHYAMFAFVIATLASPLMAHDTLPAGIWTNNEDVYFAEEEGREKSNWTAIEVWADRSWRRIDAFGEAQSDWSSEAIPNLSRREGGGWQISSSELRLANPMSCWVAVRKFAGKPDGSEDWTFQRELPIYDQGGRILIPGNDIAPDVTIRVRNVTWAKGSNNKPVRVIYVHKQDPVRAESYAWSAPDSEIVGINLRWVQASCSATPTQIEGI